MGCCCSKAPTAEEYLAQAVATPCADPLLPGMPNAMSCDRWPFILSSVNDNCGVGEPTTISVINSANQQALATIEMPPRRSFGIGATVTDAAGNPFGWLRSAESQRAQGMNPSSYYVFASRPQIQGQQPSALDTAGTQGYMWATVTRAPFTSKVTVTNASGANVYDGRTVMGFDTSGMQTFLLSSSPDGNGVLHMSKVKTKPPVHSIRAAQGGDPLLFLLIKFAAEMADNELYQSNDR